METAVKDLEHASFPEMAQRISALYNEEEDALLLGMLGQDYVIRHNAILLHGQNAPDSHASVILDYLFSTGTVLNEMPWRSMGNFTGEPNSDFRKKVELPLTQYVAEIITRAKSLLPLFDANPAQSIIGSDMAFTVRALPKVYLHVEMSQETQDFPSESWVLFSNNANEFLTVPSIQTLAEIFKERVLSSLRIY
jgi:hypothetical protein